MALMHEIGGEIAGHPGEVVVGREADAAPVQLRVVPDLESPSDALAQAEAPQPTAEELYWQRHAGGTALAHTVSIDERRRTTLPAPGQEGARGDLSWEDKNIKRYVASLNTGVDHDPYSYPD
jgi:hypothetical protein